MVKVLRPFLCCMRMCIGWVWADISSVPLEASEKGSRKWETAESYLLNSSWSLNLIRRKKCRIKRNYRKFGDSGLTCEFLETNLLEISLKWRWMFTIREDFLNSFRVSCKCEVDGRAQTERYKRNWCHRTSSVMWHSDRFNFVCSVNARKTPNCCH